MTALGPASSANFWPHALDSLFEHGKRKSKQYFPEGLPGLFALSKTEVADDIDLIEADIDLLSPARNRRRACRQEYDSLKDDIDMEIDAGETSVASNPPRPTTKRQRLLDKLLDEHGIRDDARVQLTKVRRSLDDIREQILSYRDGIARLQRQIGQCAEEEQQLKASFEERQCQYKQSAAALEQSRAQFEVKLKDAADDLEQQTNQVELLQRVEQATVVKDIRIKSLELELEAARREIAVLKDLKIAASNPSSDVVIPTSRSDSETSIDIEVEEASGSVTQASSMQIQPPSMQNQPSVQSQPPIQDTRLEAFVRHYTNDLQELTNRLKNASGRVLELERQKNDLEHSLLLTRDQLEAAQKESSEASARNQVLKKTISEQQEQLSQREEELMNVRNTAGRLSLDIEMGQERLAARAMVMEAADRRAVFAEKSLHDVVQMGAILKSGNVQLQGKYNKLLKTHLKAIEDHAALVSVADRLTHRLSQSEAESDGTSDPDASLKRSLRHDLNNILLDIAELRADKLMEERAVDEQDDAEMLAVGGSEGNVGSGTPGSPISSINPNPVSVDDPSGAETSRSSNRTASRWRSARA